MSTVRVRAEAYLEMSGEKGENLVCEAGVNSPDPGLAKRLDENIPLAIETWINAMCAGAANMIEAGTDRGMGTREEMVKGLVEKLNLFLDFKTTTQFVRIDNNPSTN